MCSKWPDIWIFHSFRGEIFKVVELDGNIQWRCISKREKSHGKIFGTLQHLEGKGIILKSRKRDCRVPKVEGQTLEYDILIAEVRKDFVSLF